MVIIWLLPERVKARKAMADTSLSTLGSYTAILPTLSGGMSHELPPLVAKIAFPLLQAIGIAGNLTIIFVYIYTKSLRLPINLFIINLAIADTMILCVTAPTDHIVIANGGRPIARGEGCFWTALSAMVGAGASLNSMVTIAGSRYLCIVHPQQKQRFLTWPKCLAVSLFSWAYSVFCTIPALTGWGRVIWKPKEFTCTYDFGHNIWANVFIYVFLFGVNSVAIVFFYLKIYRVVRLSKTRVNMATENQHNTKTGRKNDDIRLAIQVKYSYTCILHCI